MNELQTINLLGHVQVTTLAASSLRQVQADELLRLHKQGHWGVISPAEEKHNRAALADGGTVHSVYPSGDVFTYDILTFQCDCNRWPQRFEGPAVRTLFCLNTELPLYRCECLWRNVPHDLKRTPYDAMPRPVADAFDQVFTHCWSQEMKSYEACSKAARKEHVFRAMVLVCGWFYGGETNPDLMCRFMNRAKVSLLGRQIYEALVRWTRRVPHEL